MNHFSGCGKLLQQSIVGLAPAIGATLVLAAGALVVGGVAPAAAAAHASHAPVKVGYILPLTGVAAANGTDEENGFKLGLQKFAGRSETVDGHKIDTTYLDTGGSATVALADAKRFISEHYNIVEGPILGSSTGVVSPYLLTHGMPVDDLYLLTPKQIMGYKTDGLGLASGFAGYQVSTIGAKWAYETMGWRHITTVGGDYSYGWEMIGGFATEFEKLGGTITKEIWVPETATDLSSYVSQISPSTQAVYGELTGGQVGTFFKDYKAFGLQGKVPVLGETTLTDQSGIADATVTATEGALVVSQYCDDLPSKTNQTFADAYHGTYGLWPAYYSESAYVQAEILVTALKSVKGKATTPKKLVRAMRAVKISAPRGPVKINTTAYAPTQNTYICKVELKGGSLRNVPVKTYKNVPPWGVLTTATWSKQFAAQSTGRPS